MYKRQVYQTVATENDAEAFPPPGRFVAVPGGELHLYCTGCLLYTSDAADERSSVDLGGRRIIKKKRTHKLDGGGIQE